MMKNSNPDQEITFKSKSSFLYSFFLLPKEKREAIYTLYAFCRQTDDIADNLEPAEKRMQKLNAWEREFKNCFSKSVSNYFNSLKQVTERFRIPVDYFLELIQGVRMDVANLRYKSFEELKVYCYRVASTVGLMCIQIFGYDDPVIRKYAEDLGIALQLTNIIRDVGTDAQMGRIYVPEKEMQKFNVSERDILNNNYTENFRKLMEYQAMRAHDFYKKATEHLPLTEQKNMLVSEIMKNIYFHLLRKIEENHFDVFDSRIRLSTPQKAVITLKTVWDINFAK